MVVAVHLQLGLALHEVVKDEEFDKRFGGRLALTSGLRWHETTKGVVVLFEELPHIIHIIESGQAEALAVDFVEQILGQRVQHVVQKLFYSTVERVRRVNK